jgi:tRNA uridine 5-carboxymethylaminomethyl modification enzyme
LPEDVQFKALRSVKGFENVKFFRPGYAIEYDFFPPDQLELSLQTKHIQNLYFAGQINGTTGYEEAGCQGLMAGLNAHLKINKKEPFVLKRSEAYIGVLIDDLVTKGTNEPYRMFTSRAEYRILLRQDNADLRLTPKAHELGLASDERMDNVQQKMTATKSIVDYFKKTSALPDRVNPCLRKCKTPAIKQKVKLFSLITRPQLGFSQLEEALPEIGEFVRDFGDIAEEGAEQATIQMKYAGYIDKEHEMVEKMARLENIKLYPDFEYARLTSLSSEAREKLEQIKPETIGQASRISGVSPADISVLMVYLGR